MYIIYKEYPILTITPLKTEQPDKTEIVMGHNGEPVLRIMADSNLYYVFSSVATLCYDLGKRDMRIEDSKPKIN